MLHTFRLLDMAIEIGKTGKVNVQRPNRDFLLGIKSGKYEYADLLKMASERNLAMEEAFEQSALPESPDMVMVKQLVYQLRDRFYNS